jgi:hypothetical protein
MPNNCSFTLETIHRRKSCQTSHKHCPSKSSSSRTSVLSFQIPKVLRSGSSGANGTTRKVIRSLSSSFCVTTCCSYKKRYWSINRPKLHAPNTSVNNDIDNTKNNNTLLNNLVKG